MLNFYSFSNNHGNPWNPWSSSGESMTIFQTGFCLKAHCGLPMIYGRQRVFPYHSESSFLTPIFCRLQKVPSPESTLCTLGFMGHENFWGHRNMELDSWIRCLSSSWRSKRWNWTKQTATGKGPKGPNWCGVFGRVVLYTQKHDFPGRLPFWKSRPGLIAEIFVSPNDVWDTCFSWRHDWWVVRVCSGTCSSWRDYWYGTVTSRKHPLD